MKIFYFTFFIFLVMSPQAFSNEKCSSNSFSSKLNKQELNRLLTYPIRSFNVSPQTIDILEHNNIHLLADLVGLTEAKLLKLSIHGEYKFINGKYKLHRKYTSRQTFFEQENLIEAKTLLSAIGLQLGMTEVVSSSDQKKTELIEAHKSNRTLPPVLAYRIITKREERILRMHMGIGEEKPHTLREIAQSFNLNLERIRQLQVKALRKLREFTRDRLQWKDDEWRSDGHQERSFIQSLSRDQVEELIEAHKSAKNAPWWHWSTKVE